ncbi:MAG: hypothetical protein PUG74_11790, partial [Prevotellaceae bacterium]|nr:hypothetical protein [Prevotellaceae bacterium]
MKKIIACLIIVLLLFSAVAENSTKAEKASDIELYQLVYEGIKHWKSYEKGIAINANEKLDKELLETLEQRSFFLNIYKIKILKTLEKEGSLILFAFVDGFTLPTQGLQKDIESGRVDRIKLEDATNIDKDLIMWWDSNILKIYAVETDTGYQFINYDAFIKWQNEEIDSSLIAKVDFQDIDIDELQKSSNQEELFKI